VLDTVFLSLMESDPTEELMMIIGIFTHFFALKTTLAECQFFHALAKLVGHHTARLSSCGIAAIVTKMGYLDAGCSVGADGSLYNVPLCAFCLSLGRLLSPWREREQSELIVTATVSRRNTLASRNVCMRPAGHLWQERPVSHLTAPLIFAPRIFSEQIFSHFFTLSSVETLLPIVLRTEAVSVALSSLVRGGIA